MARQPTGYVKVVAPDRVEAYAPPDPNNPTRKRGAYLGVFKTAELAQAAVDQARAEIEAGDFLDPAAERTRLDTWFRNWMENPPRHLSGNTRALYESNYRLHIKPKLGHKTLVQINQTVVRQWHADLQRKYPKPSPLPAKVYRQLKALLQTAVDEGPLRKHGNPCRIRGAGQERARERPVAARTDVHQIAGLVAAWRRALILVAAYTGLRLGELSALRREDVDLLHHELIVRRSYSKADKADKETKNEDERRVLVPDIIWPDVERHMAEYVQPAPDSFVFPGPKGGRLRSSNWSKEWKPVREAVGMPAGFTMHDLRHTGNTWFAETGATRKEMKDRMGHRSDRAAAGYEHARAERREELIDRMSEQAAADLANPKVRRIR